jgi:3-methylcrotonyl-CoA carboxylase alpha subunit
LAQEHARLAASREREPDEPTSPWDEADAFQLSGARRLALPILAEDKTVVAEIVYGPQGPAVSVGGNRAAKDAVAVPGGDAVYVLHNGRQTKVRLRDLALDEAGDQDGSGVVRAPMHGKILNIFVEQGAQVTRGQRVAIIEAMKMEHTLVAPIDGIVAEIAVALDGQVAEGAKVMLIETVKV